MYSRLSEYNNKNHSKVKAIHFGIRCFKLMNEGNRKIGDGDDKLQLQVSSGFQFFTLIILIHKANR